MSPEFSSHFIDQLTSSQTKMFGCIMTLVANSNDAKDILQKANLTLWRNASRYDPERPFLPWAIATARLEVRAFYRDLKRDRLVFDDDLLQELQSVADSRIEDLSLRQEALRSCLMKVNQAHRSLLSLRYAQGKSMNHIALVCERSVDGVRSLMLRLRKSLRLCIEAELNSQSSSKS